MVIQILPRDTRLGELGEGISNIGQAAGSGLGYLIGSKMAQVRARNAFESFGMDQGQADRLSRLPMQQRNAILNDIAERRGYTEQAANIPAGQFQLQPQTQQRLAALAAMQMTPQTTGTQALPITSPMMQAQQTAQIPLQQAQAQMALGGPRGMLQGSEQGLQALQQARQQALMGYQPQQQPAQITTQPQRQLGEAPRPFPQQLGQPLNLPSEGLIRQPNMQPMMQAQQPLGSPQGTISGPSPKYRAQMAREARAERDLELKEIEAQRKAAKDAYTMQRAEDERAWEFNKTEVKHIRDRAIEAKEVIKSYDRLIKDAQSGNLRSGNTQQLLEKLGLGAFNQNLTTQQAAKEVARLAQGIGASALGRGRVTNYLEQTYQRALPTLWNTPQGIIMISRINKLDNQANIEIDNARKEIMKENGGKIPFDFVDQVYERAEPKINALQEQALNIIDESIGNKRGTSLTQAYANNDNTANPSNIGGYLGVVPRAVEEVAGLPGNIVAGAASLGRYITGQNNPVGQAFKAVEEYAPTSEAIRRNVTKPLTGEFFEPKNEAQQLAQNVASTAAGLAAPMGAVARAANLPKLAILGEGLGVKKAVGLATAGTAAQQAASALGFGQVGQQLAKTAAIMSGSMYGGRAQLQAVESNAYNTAREIAGDSRESARALSNDLIKIKKAVNNAAMDATEQAQVKSMIDSISRNISKGKNPTIQVNAAHEAKKQINDYLRNNENISNTTKGFLAKTKQPLNNVLEQFGKTVPEYGQQYKLAEELHKGLMANNNLSKFLMETTTIGNYLQKNPALKAMLGIGSLGAAKYVGQTPLFAGTAAAVIGTREASRLFDILRASPAAQKHYLDLVKASRTGSINEAMKALHGLNNEVNNV